MPFHIKGNWEETLLESEIYITLFKCHGVLMFLSSKNPCFRNKEILWNELRWLRMLVCFWIRLSWNQNLLPIKLTCSTVLHQLVACEQWVTNSWLVMCHWACQREVIDSCCSLGDESEKGWAIDLHAIPNIDMHKSAMNSWLIECFWLWVIRFFS